MSLLETEYRELFNLQKPRAQTGSSCTCKMVDEMLMMSDGCKGRHLKCETEVEEWLTVVGVYEEL